MASEEFLMDVNQQPEPVQHGIANAQDKRVLFRRTNFFVLAPLYQDRQFHRSVSQRANPGGPVSEDWIAAGRYEIEVADERIAARVSLRPFYDPASERVRR